MTELEKIVFAKSYIEKLANGVNPLTDQVVSDMDVINNVRISRCLFYVSDLLRQILDNDGISHKKSRIPKKPFYLGHEARKGFRYSKMPIPVSEITRRINELISDEDMTKLNYKHILNWLFEIGALHFVSDDEGKMTRQPISTGLHLGIHIEKRLGARGTYHVIVYDEIGQQFILDHLDDIIEYNKAHKSVGL